MSTSVMHAHESTTAADGFRALEERVLRAVELLKAERESRAAAEARVAQLESRAHGLQEQIASKDEHIGRLEGDLQHFQGERDEVRERVERLLSHLDEFTN